MTETQKLRWHQLDKRIDQAEKHILQLRKGLKGAVAKGNASRSLTLLVIADSLKLAAPLVPPKQVDQIFKIAEGYVATVFGLSSGKLRSEELSQLKQDVFDGDRLLEKISKEFRKRLVNK